MSLLTGRQLVSQSIKLMSGELNNYRCFCCHKTFNFTFRGYYLSFKRCIFSNFKITGCLFLLSMRTFKCRLWLVLPSRDSIGGMSRKIVYTRRKIDSQSLAGCNDSRNRNRCQFSVVSYRIESHWVLCMCISIQSMLKSLLPLYRRARWTLVKGADQYSNTGIPDSTCKASNQV